MVGPTPASTAVATARKARAWPAGRASTGDELRSTPTTTPTPRVPAGARVQDEETARALVGPHAAAVRAASTLRPRHRTTNSTRSARRTDGRNFFCSNVRYVAALVHQQHALAEAVLARRRRARRRPRPRRRRSIWKTTTAGAEPAAAVARWTAGAKNGSLRIACRIVPSVAGGRRRPRRTSCAAGGVVLPLHSAPRIAASPRRAAAARLGAALAWLITATYCGGARTTRRSRSHRSDRRHRRWPRAARRAAPASLASWSRSSVNGDGLRAPGRATPTRHRRRVVGVEEGVRERVHHDGGAQRVAPRVGRDRRCRRRRRGVDVEAPHASTRAQRVRGRGGPFMSPSVLHRSAINDHTLRIAEGGEGVLPCVEGSRRRRRVARGLVGLARVEGVVGEHDPAVLPGHVRVPVTLKISRGLRAEATLLRAAAPASLRPRVRRPVCPPMRGDAGSRPPPTPRARCRRPAVARSSSGRPVQLDLPHR